MLFGFLVCNVFLVVMAYLCEVFGQLSFGHTARKDLYLRWQEMEIRNPLVGKRRFEHMYWIHDYNAQRYVQSSTYLWSSFTVKNLPPPKPVDLEVSSFIDYLFIYNHHATLNDKLLPQQHIGWRPRKVYQCMIQQELAWAHRQVHCLEIDHFFSAGSAAKCRTNYGRIIVAEKNLGWYTRFVKNATEKKPDAACSGVAISNIQIRKVYSRDVFFIDNVVFFVPMMCTVGMYLVVWTESVMYYFFTRTYYALMKCNLFAILMLVSWFRVNSLQ